MPKIRIKTKAGTSVTIEGTEAEISRIAAYLENQSTAKKDINRESAVKDGNKEKMRKQRSTASSLIIELREEGYFDKPKTLGEIASVLQEKGYIYPTTAISGIMLDLVQRKMLGRKKVDKRWKYGK